MYLTDLQQKTQSEIYKLMWKKMYT